MNVCVLLSLVLLCSDHVSSLNCYIDSKGVPEPAIGGLLDKTAFKTLQCNILKEDPEKPCMTRTDSTGVVRRSCSPVTPDPDSCEEDRYGNRYCYCNTDLCNGSDPQLNGC